MRIIAYEYGSPEYKAQRKAMEEERKAHPGWHTHPCNCDEEVWCNSDECRTDHDGSGIGLSTEFSYEFLVCEFCRAENDKAAAAAKEVRRKTYLLLKHVNVLVEDAKRNVSPVRLDDLFAGTPFGDILQELLVKYEKC